MPSMDQTKRYKVTLKAYGMTQTRYIAANSAADARRRANGMTSIGSVVRVEEVPELEPGHVEIYYKLLSRS